MAGETRLALDFEPGDFSRFSGVEQGNVSQSIIGSSPVRTGFGTKSCKFSNIPGVRWVNGSMRSLAARYDTNETVGQEYFFASSLRFPSGADQISNGQLLWELHHRADLYNLNNLGVAPHSIRKNGTGAIIAYTGAGLGTVNQGYATLLNTTILASPPADQWIDFIIWIYFTEANNGFVRWYVDDTGSAAFVQGSPTAERTGIPTLPYCNNPYVHNEKLYHEHGIYNTAGTNANQSDTDAYYSMGWRREVSWANAVAQFGSGGGGGTSQPPPPVDPPVDPPGVPGDGPPVDAGGAPGSHNLAATPESAIRFKCGPAWRFAVTNLDGEVVTILDHLASDRVVTPKLNEALEVTCSVPSDNAEINRLHTDGFPFVAEGVRQLYCFRRESVLPPYYRVRAATLIMQTTDAGGADPARTTITAWDPWQYMMSRPVLVSVRTPVDYGEAGDQIQGSITYPPYDPLATPGTPLGANEIALDMISNTIVFGGLQHPDAPAAAKACFLDLAGTVDDPAINERSKAFSLPGYRIEQGTSLGQALQDLCSQGWIDIVLRPIFDPVNRPGILAVVDIFNQYEPATGAGYYRYGAVFAWDKPSRSISGINQVIDGTLRANVINLFYDIGGPPVGTVQSGFSLLTYGEYQVQQFYPKQALEPGVDNLGKMELDLRKYYKQTVTVNPTPERAPQPFVDYAIGDRVPIYASNKLRQQIPPDLDQGDLPLTTVAWQRVYGIPIQINDNGVETVQELIVGPVGAPPPIAGAGITGSSQLGATSTNVAVNTAATRTFAGARGALGPMGSRP